MAKSRRHLVKKGKSSRKGRKTYNRKRKNLRRSKKGGQPENLGRVVSRDVQGTTTAARTAARRASGTVRGDVQEAATAARNATRRVSAVARRGAKVAAADTQNVVEDLGEKGSNIQFHLGRIAANVGASVRRIGLAVSKHL